MRLCAYIHDRGKKENKEGLFERNESEINEGENPEWNCEVGGEGFREGMGWLLKTVIRREDGGNIMAKLIFCHLYDIIKFIIFCLIN